MIAVTLGTRPEIIKLAPLIRELEKSDLDYSIVHTNQHYSPNMDSVFFSELSLKKPDYNLSVGSGAHGVQTGKMLELLEKVYDKTDAEMVVTLGDTNTTIAASITAAKSHIRLVHAEAGFRSFDRRMPEEINRIVSDHISDMLFSPCSLASDNLLREGIDPQDIYDTGNTILDSVIQNLPIAKQKSSVFSNLDVGSYCLITSHRAENTDNIENMRSILSSIPLIIKEHDCDVIFPVHPRTQKMIRKFNLDHMIYGQSRLHVIEPQGYFDFLMLEEGALCVITDSGGVQDECFSLDVPTVIIRDSTEKTDIISERFCLSSVEPEMIARNVSRAMATCPVSGKYNPYGSGHAGRLMREILEIEADN
jgi:UDP-N-acetylglucosamine 2-epimerase (non-hydrolysing)